jgi:hypothetical protein
MSGLPAWKLADYSAAATAIGVLLAAWQLRRTVKQARVDFEDDLNREFRQITMAIPANARFGDELSDADFDGAFPSIYQYFDLTNEQVFLRMNGRVSKIAWADWNGGIQSTLAKPAFKKAWSRVVESSNSFSELRRLVKSDFKEDPYYWVSLWGRVRRWLRQ